MMSYRSDILNQGTIGLEIFLCVGTFFFYSHKWDAIADSG